MKAGRFFTTVLAVMASGLILVGCQTTASAPDTATPAMTSTPSAAATTADPKSVTPEMARNLANNCFTCHGPKGKSAGTIPSLHLLSAQRIVTKLRDFKSGAEPSTVMGRLAQAYTDAEMEAVAHYIVGPKK